MFTECRHNRITSHYKSVTLLASARPVIGHTAHVGGGCWKVSEPSNHVADVNNDNEKLS